MPRRSDSRVLDDQLLTLVARAERFATVFCQRAQASLDGHLVDPGWVARKPWLETLARGAMTPYALIAGIVLADRGASGQRNGDDGVVALGVALLDTLCEVIGDGFTEQARAAWSRAIVDVSDWLDDAPPDPAS